MEPPVARHREQPKDRDNTKYYLEIGSAEIFANTSDATLDLKNDKVKARVETAWHDKLKETRVRIGTPLRPTMFPS